MSHAEPERFELLLADLQRVVHRLECALQRADQEFAADSALLHFNLAFEVSWKLLRLHAARAGVPAPTPRAAFRHGLQVGLITDEATFERILRQRNDAVHLYRASMARALLIELPDFHAAFAALHAAVSSRPNEAG
jgi:nucleotidyltransferase substrate binding protein (TIGR01987 family)